MAKYAFAVPELPGKDSLSIPAYNRANMGAYEASRKRAHITMERVYRMPTPMGTFVIAYIESADHFPATMIAFTKGDAFDKGFLERVADVHGFDVTKPPPGPPPEVVGDWSDPAVKERRKGLAFTAPLKPGKADAGRLFAREAFERRRADLTASRRAIGDNREVVCLNFMPMGEIISVYLEGHNPAAANADFAASKSAYDIWFKAECSKIFMDGIDFNKPLPPIAQIWDWQTT